MTAPGAAERVVGRRRPGAWVAAAPLPHVLGAAVLVAVALGLVHNLLPGDERQQVARLNLLQLVCVGLAAWAALDRRRTETGRGRVGWGLLGAGLSTIGVSTAGGTYVVLVHRSLDPPPVLDSLDGLGLLLFAAGLLALCGNVPGSPRALALLDTVMASAACVFVVWEGLLVGDELTVRERVLCAYLGGMALLLVLALLLAARWRGDGRTLALLGAALGLELCSVVAITIASVQGADIDLTHPVLGLAFPLGTALIGAAGRQRPASSAASAPLRRQWDLALGLPLASAAVVAAGTVLLVLAGRPWDVTGTSLAIGVGLLLFLRQGLTLLDNRRLTLGLEQLVAERTSELLESRRHFRDLVQHSTDVIAVMSSAGRITYCSPAVQAVLGYAVEDVVGLQAGDLVHPDDRSAVAGLVQALDTGERGAVIALRVRHADGSWRSIEATAGRSSVVRDDQTYVVNMRDVTERTLLEERLRHQAFHDPLTGLANRALIQERMRHALLRARRSGEPTALVFVDLDHFKRLNDTAGHTVGDQALVQVADVIRSCIRPEDTAARLGGDEFAVLLEDSGTEHGAVVAGRIVDALKQLAIPHQRMHLSGASVGVSVAEGGRTDGEALLRDADIAMYQAKAAGRGRAAVFEPTMRERLVRELAMEGALHRALDGHELTLAFQPIVDLADDRVVALEALVRWQDERGLPVPPALFIPLAEQVGLVGALDRWVLQEACGYLASLDARCPSLAGVALNVNVSARDLDDPQALEAWVAQALSAAGLEPDRLVLEITETAVLPDLARLAPLLRSLRARGVRVSLDDFGTGYSSMSSLEQLPLDELKIDGSFVAGLEEGETAARVVEGIVGMARSLRLPVVAEAVESQAQVDLLRRIHCDYGQGWFFGAPMAAAELEDWGAARQGRVGAA